MRGPALAVGCAWHRLMNAAVETEPVLYSLQGIDLAGLRPVSKYVKVGLKAEHLCMSYYNHFCIPIKSEVGMLQNSTFEHQENF